MSRIFYKYRNDTAYTEALVTSGQVFLATAPQLNDPFECTVREIGEEWLAEHIRSHMAGALSGFLSGFADSKNRGIDFFGLPPVEAEGAIGSILVGDDLETRYVAMRQFIKERNGHPPHDCRLIYRRIEDQLGRTGIFSMSIDPAQPLMWVHYGQDHRGLAFGFRAVAGSKLADPDHCLPVLYSDELPAMSEQGLTTRISFAADRKGRMYTLGVDIAFNDKTLQRVVTTKPTCWSYEQEYRYIEPFGGICPWPGDLAECTFGLRCPDVRRQHYIALLKAHVPNDVSLFEIRRKPGTNAIERVPFDPPVIHGRKRAKGKPKQKPGRRTMTGDIFFAKMQQLLQQGKFGDVIVQTEDNLKRSPGDPLLLYYRATALGHAGEHEDALEIFSGLSEQQPDWADLWYNMGCALQELGRMDDALQHFERAYELDPEDASHALNLGNYLVAIPDRKSEGLALLHKADRLGHRRAPRLIAKFEGTRSSSEEEQ